MKAQLIALAGLLFLSLNAARAHRLDDYLQATFISVERDQLKVDLFLTPGLTVLPAIFAAIDTDGNGQFSEAEQRGYADRVRRDLLFAVDGTVLVVELTAFEFPTTIELREGRGDIHLKLVVKLFAIKEATAKLRFENRHLGHIAAYQVNCLAPRDPRVRIGEQLRDPLQSVFEVEVGIAR